MLDFLWDLVVWLVQIVGTWALVAGSVVLLLLRVSFSVFAVVRSITAAALVLALAYQYGFATDGLIGWMNALTAKYTAMAAVAAVALLILSFVYVAIGPPGGRKARCGRLFLVTTGDVVPGPLTVLLALGATAGFLYWSVQAASGYESGLVRFLSVLLLAVPAAVFLIFVPLSVAGTVFNAANAHPALPSLAAPFVAIAGVVVDRLVGGVIATPNSLQDPLAITGLLAAVALSAAELVQLHRRGESLTRDLPGHRPGPGPAHRAEGVGR